MREAVGLCRVAIVSDSTVDALCGDPVERSLRDAGYDALRCVFPAGERNKTLATLGGILEFLAENHLTRADVVVALGGGAGGFGGQRRANQPRKGKDLQKAISITFEEAAFGCEKEINVGRVEQCPDCKGTGSVRTTQRTPFGMVQTSGACKKCGATFEN